MATWDEVKGALKGQFTVDVDEREMFAVRVDFEDGRHQQVYARCKDVLGRELLELRSLACKEDRLDAREALKLSAEMALGGLVLHEGMYVVQHVIDMASTGGDGFDFAVQAVASIADNLEHNYSAMTRDLF